MTNIVPTPTPTKNELMTADAPCLIQLALSWRVVDPVPDALGESIDDLGRLLLSGLSPCPLDAYVVLLDKLFVATERPSDAALKTWRERLEKYPEAILSRAIDSVLDSHVYASAPKVASICTAANTDTAWADMKMVDLRMRTLKTKWDGQQQRHRYQDMADAHGPMPEDVLSEVQKAAYASQRAMKQRIDAEQERRKAERKAKYKMSPAEEAKANKAALNTKTMKAAMAKVGVER